MSEVKSGEKGIYKSNTRFASKYLVEFLESDDQFKAKKVQPLSSINAGIKRDFEFEKPLSKD